MISPRFPYFESMIVSLELTQHICIIRFTTFVNIYIFLWEPIVHDHSGSWFEVGGVYRYKKIRGILVLFPKYNLY